GDRLYGDDPAIIAGVGRYHDQPIAIVGQQKGRDTAERTYRNFGMPGPEGYRKAMRVMELAERLEMPVVTLIDTPGAAPAVGPEPRGGAHRDPDEAARLLDGYLSRALRELRALTPGERRRQRAERYRRLGSFRDSALGNGAAIAAGRSSDAGLDSLGR